MKMESEMLDSGRSTSQLFATLQARKDTLEAKLHDKTQELKSLCIKEAELTGVLPPEIPLEAGESPPPFRRRIGTAFTYPENLINNSSLKSKEEGKLAQLELEYKIQKDIADAALGLANDCTLSKAVRRKHRQEYQKTQCRLMSLEKRLNILRQSSGQGCKPQHLKQRKKPRPPLDAEYREHDPILRDEGISLSPLGPLHGELEHDLCQRQWDHGAHTLGHHPVAVDATLASPRYYTLYNGLQDGKMIHHRRSPGGMYSHQYSNQHYTVHSPFNHHDFEHVDQQERLDQGHTVPGYWLRYENDPESPYYPAAPKSYHARTLEDVVDAMPRQHNAGTKSDSALVQNSWLRERERFGSLGRRKTHPTSQSNSNPCSEDWEVEEQGLSPPYGYLPVSHTEVRDNVSGLGGGGAILPSQTYPEHSLGMDNRRLVRTQSLGSVDTVQSCVANNNEMRTVKNSLQMHAQASDTLSRKQKEKEWYETSLDGVPSSPSLSVQHSYPPPQRSNGLPVSEMKGMCSNDAPSLHQHNELVPDVLPSDQTSDASSNISRSSSNVSADHHSHQLHLKTKVQEVVGNENFDTVVPFESPKNIMVVQAGKWQPYREVTKPFEMADFYKYSTKFRKNAGSGNSRNEQVNQHSGEIKTHASDGVSTPQISTASSVPYHPSSHSSASLYSQPRSSPSNGSPTPQQKGIYQPLQPMTCQPLDPSDIRSRVVSPNMSVDGRLVLGNGESLADSFSTEMLAWYQDQNIPRSATLV
ncbi:uncharacterized protein sstn [Anabrus simplex]|uniref:uncharacterized protein sstn n=1 Tax=Anabrus simplex TaxID=316456 RepID=UPI0035A304CC